MRIATLAALLAALLSVQGVAQNASQNSAALATVDGKAIPTADVEKSIATDLAKLEAQIYELKKNALNALIDEQLLAQEASKRGITTAALIQAEITSKPSQVTDEEVAIYYGANQAKLQKDLNAWREQIRAFLGAQKAAERRQAFLKELREQHKVEVLLKSPPILRVDISTAGAFAKGPENAPITLVEFSDFHCPFCKRVEPTVKQVLAKYDGKIRFVTRSDKASRSFKIQVIDNGPGVPPKVAAKIFDPFFTTKPVGIGTGLGLSISHGIVSEHGGTIRFENAVGGGAIFTIELPTGTDTLA
jgi:nitrogen fixation/metabolism regulation signal transduction histidine kinase